MIKVKLSKLFFLSFIKFSKSFLKDFKRFYRGKMEEIKQLIIILKKQNISLEKAAGEIGISFQTIWNWIDAKHEPSKLALVQLKKFIKKHEDKRTEAALVAEEN